MSSVPDIPAAPFMPTPGSPNIPPAPTKPGDIPSPPIPGQHPTPWNW